MKRQKRTNVYCKLPMLDGLEIFHAIGHKVSFPLHTHYTYNIALVLKTTLGTNIQGKTLNAPVGTLSITNPNDVRATLCESKVGNTFFTFYVSPEVVKALNKNSNVYFEDKVIYDTELFKKFYFLSQKITNTDNNFESLFTTALQELILNYNCKTVFKTKNISLFESFINEVDMETFSLERTASKFGLDKYKFLRLFKQSTGLTPNHYRIMQRIEKSKHLLNHSNSIADVAIASGFYDSAHFYRHFKNFVGITPLAYKSA